MSGIAGSSQPRGARLPPARVAVAQCPIGLGEWQRVNTQLVIGLVAAAATVVGALIGITGTLLSARFQRINTLKLEQQRDFRTRAVEAAQRCANLIGEATDTVTALVRASSSDDEVNFSTSDTEGQQNELQRFSERLSALDHEIAKLPPDLGERLRAIKVALSTLWTYKFDQQPRAASFYMSAELIASYASAEACRVINAFLNGYRLPPKSNEWLQIEAASRAGIRDLKRRLNAVFAKDESHAKLERQRAQAEQRFLGRHPVLRTRRALRRALRKVRR